MEVRQWFEKDKRRYEAEVKDLKSHYPDLLIYKRPVLLDSETLELRAAFVGKEKLDQPCHGSELVIEGPYSFEIPTSGERITYFIRIVFPRYYPRIAPTMFCIDQRLSQRNLDRHIMEGGQACLCTPNDIRLFFKEEDKISTFIAKLVHPYLVGQYLYDINGRWMMPDRDHGKMGIIQSYQEYFGQELSPESVIRLVQYSSKHQNIRGNDLCPCGSRKLIKKCHFTELSKFYSSFSSRDLDADLKKIAS